MPFLNGVYQGIRTRINTDDIEDMSELQDAIKDEYGPIMSEIAALQILCWC